MTKKEKEPGIAAVLNIIPGVGYLYVGTRRPFAIILLISIVLSLSSTFFAPYDPAYDAIEATVWDGVSGVSFLLLEVAFIVDAYNEAKRVNKELGLS